MRYSLKKMMKMENENFAYTKVTKDAEQQKGDLIENGLNIETVSKAGMDNLENRYKGHLEQFKEKLGGGENGKSVFTPNEIYLILRADTDALRHQVDATISEAADKLRAVGKVYDTVLERDIDLFYATKGITSHKESE